MSEQSGMSPAKLIIYAGVLIAVAVGGTYYYRDRNAPKPPEFTTTTIARGEIVQTITATGQLDPLMSVDVSSQISGLVKELSVDFNTQVKEGQVLAQIDPATYQQRLRQAEADFASANASNKLAKLNWDRTQELYDKKLVTRQEYDQAMAQLAQSDATLLTRQASVENAKVDLSRCTLYSPIDGIVISKQTEVGKTVAASLNAPTLFVIANDLSKMQITAAVAEADIGSVQEGQEVTFTVDAFPNRSFQGKVSQVRNAPKITQNVVTYETIIDVDNKDLKLRPGMTANASIIVARREGALRIPNSALRVRIPEGLVVTQTTPTAGSRQVASASPAAGANPPPAVERRREGSGGERNGGNRGSRRGFGAMFGMTDNSPEAREKMRAIISEVGVDLRSGPPTSEQRERIRQLMIERGLVSPEAAAAAAGGDDAVVTTRTVYRLPGGNKAAAPESVTIQTGITDGFASEVLSGLNEGDVLVTGVALSGTTPVAGPQSGAPNPFMSQRGGDRGRRGGGF